MEGLPPNTIPGLLAAAGLALFAVAALQDLAVRLVPNGVPLGIAALGVVLRVMDGGLALGLGAAAAVFLTAAACWRRGWLGGADVKLFGAGALLVPPSATLGFVLDTCLAGGLLALAYALVGRLAGAPSAVRPVGLVPRVMRVERRRLRRGGPLPYAVALGAGACFTLWGA